MNKAQIITDLIRQDKLRPAFSTSMSYYTEESAAKRAPQTQEGTWAEVRIETQGFLGTSIRYDWYFVSDRYIDDFVRRNEAAERFVDNPLGAVAPLVAVGVALYAAWGPVADFARALSAAL